MNEIFPYALKERSLVEGGGLSISGATYDSLRQMWIHEETGRPWVEWAQESAPSPYGETAITETHEGVDQSEVVSSQIGETAFTRTHEGADQSEAVQSRSGDSEDDLEAHQIGGI